MLSKEKATQIFQSRCKHEDMKNMESKLIWSQLEGWLTCIHDKRGRERCYC